MASVTKTVKLPELLAAALSRAAAERECSESELIRQGIAKVLEGDGGIDMAATIGSDLGIGRGPRDLSSGRKRLAGYGRSRNR